MAKTYVCVCVCVCVCVFPKLYGNMTTLQKTQQNALCKLNYRTQWTVGNFR